MKKCKLKLKNITVVLGSLPRILQRAMDQGICKFRSRINAFVGLLRPKADPEGFS